MVHCTTNTAIKPSASLLGLFHCSLTVVTILRFQLLTLCSWPSFSSSLLAVIPSSLHPPLLAIFRRSQSKAQILSLLPPRHFFIIVSWSSLHCRPSLVTSFSPLFHCHFSSLFLDHCSCIAILSSLFPFNSIFLISFGRYFMGYILSSLLFSRHFTVIASLLSLLRHLFIIFSPHYDFVSVSTSYFLCHQSSTRAFSSVYLCLRSFLPFLVWVFQSPFICYPLIFCLFWPSFPGRLNLIAKSSLPFLLLYIFIAHLTWHFFTALLKRYLLYHSSSVSVCGRFFVIISRHHCS